MAKTEFVRFPTWSAQVARSGDAKRRPEAVISIAVLGNFAQLRSDVP
jgi:hypothetical protein